MGTGFYGIPLELSARVMFNTLRDHLSGDSILEKVVISVIDQREFKAFQKVLEPERNFKE
jgi:O-acetyl-ADP-ribose deacetylase (regulator of RNase III)